MGSSVFPGLQRDRAVAPAQSIDAGRPVRRAALLGVDMPGLRPRLLCAQGDRVSQGQPLFHDRAHPEINFTSPLSGVVQSITLGPRRTLSALVISAQTDGDASDSQSVTDPETGRVDASSAEKLRAALQAKGLWPSFLTRPFGRIPAPDARPDAILVTATADHSHAPDPRIVLKARGHAFSHGVEALTLLTEGLVHVCQTQGPDLVEGSHERVRSQVFESGPATGLAGHHIHLLHPVDRRGQVWTIGYQDVAAIGQFLKTGRVDPARVIALTGSHVRRPRLLRTVAGAYLPDLIEGETRPSAKSFAPGDAKPKSVSAAVLSGSPLSGRAAAWLGSYHQHVTLIDSAPERRSPSRQGLLARLWPGQAAREKAGPGPLVPIAGLDRELGFGGPAVPLLRALSVGDAEAAQRLGCLGMVEDDLAAVSMVCTSGADYGRMLRHVLDELAADA